MLIGQVLVFFAMPVFARLSDKVGHKTIFLASHVGMVIVVFPWLWLYGTGSYLWGFVAFLILYLPYAASYGTMATFFAEIYETRIAYSGLSLGYQLGAVLGGSFAPLIALWLLNQTGAITAVGYYMISAIVLSLLCASLLTTATKFKDSGTIAVAQGAK